MATSVNLGALYTIFEKFIFNMNRKPPANVIKSLRQEVKFACPIQDCANPILTWHHFDPTWKEKPHHNPEGMIALCTQHHPLADGGNWTKEELYKFKTTPPSIDKIRKKISLVRKNCDI